MKLFKKNKSKEEDNIWESISDLMSGLMIVFLFIAISFMSKVTKETIVIKEEQQAIQKIVETYEAIRLKIYDDLNEEFKNDIEKWNININPENLSVTFLEPEVFFETGSSDIKPEFQNILDDFFPRYINIIYGKYENNIEEVRIEGYTSSEWGDNVSLEQSYFNNMELSQGRTRNVLKHVMNLESIKPYHNWLIEHITANGMSYSHRYYDENGIEDKEKSRRVEFKIRTNADSIISDIIKEYQDKR